MAVPDRYYARLFDKIGDSRFWALAGRNGRQVIRAKRGRKTGQACFSQSLRHRHPALRDIKFISDNSEGGMAVPDRHPEALFDKIGDSRFWA